MPGCCKGASRTSNVACNEIEDMDKCNRRLRTVPSVPLDGGAQDRLQAAARAVRRAVLPDRLKCSRAQVNERVNTLTTRRGIHSHKICAQRCKYLGLVCFLQCVCCAADCRVIAICFYVFSCTEMRARLYSFWKKK